MNRRELRRLAETCEAPGEYDFDPQDVLRLLDALDKTETALQDAVDLFGNLKWDWTEGTINQMVGEEILDMTEAIAAIRALDTEEEK